MKGVEVLKKHRFVILGVDHFNTLGMVRSLGEAGIRPDVVLVEHYRMVKASKYVNNLYIASSIEQGLEYIISEYSREKEKPFLLTGSDPIISVIDRNYNRLIDKFYFFNAGEEGKISFLLSKKEQNMLAKSCGFNVPMFEEVCIGDKPTKVPYPLITKAIDSTVDDWKSQVYICHNENELADAYSHLKGERILLQQYIEKSNETGFNALSVNGGEETYLPLQLTYNETTEKSFGNLIYLFEPKDMELCEKIKNLIQKTHYCGIFSIDLLIGKDKKIYFLEVNFRNSGWSYPYTCAGVNLPILWAQSVLENHIDVEKVKIKKLPYSAIADYGVLATAFHRSFSEIVKSFKKIWKCDSRILWNLRDLGPVWPVIREFINNRF